MQNRKSTRSLALGACSLALAATSLISGPAAHAMGGITVGNYRHLRLCEEAQGAWNSDPSVQYTECRKVSDTSFDLIVFGNE